MKNIKSKTIQNIVWNLVVIISIVVIAVCISPVSFQNDTFYTIKIGEKIAKEGLTQPDTFTIHEDLPYTYPHWLFDLGVYEIYSFSGFSGLYIAQTILAVVLGLLLYYTTKKLFGQKIVSYIISCTLLLLFAPFISVRAQVITYIMFILEIYFLESFFKKQNKLYLLGLIIISLVIVNVHIAVWPFFFVLFLPYLISIIKINIGGKIYSEKYKGYIWLILAIVICALTGLLTPLKDAPYTYMVNTMKGITMNHITEHQPVVVASNLGVKFIICFLLTVVAIYLFNIKMSTKNLALIAGMLIMAFKSNRNISLFYLVMSFIIADIISQIIEGFKNGKYREFTDSIEMDAKSEKLLGFLKKWGEEIFSIVIIVLIIIIMVVCGRPKLNQKFINESQYPVKAAEFINNNQDKEKLDKETMVLFNEYNYGSYLMLENIKVFIDSRADLYTKEFNKKEDIFTDYIDTTGLNNDYEEIFTKYKITHVILYKNSKLSRLLLSKDSNYEAIYDDGNFVIYKRNLVTY